MIRSMKLPKALTDAWGLPELTLTTDEHGIEGATADLTTLGYLGRPEPSEETPMSKPERITKRQTRAEVEADQALIDAARMLAALTSGQLALLLRAVPTSTLIDIIGLAATRLQERHLGNQR